MNKITLSIPTPKKPLDVLQNPLGRNGQSHRDWHAAKLKQHPWKGKHPTWTPYDLKKIVGDRLKSHGTFERMLDEEGRRCWTLNYANSSKFHMDILPSLVGSDYDSVLNKAFSSLDFEMMDSLAIRITDKEWGYHE